MVHIPFLNIEVPEPRILEIIPDVVVTVLRLCARIVDAAMDTVYPLDQEGLRLVTTAQRNAVPREFDRVLQRTLEGKIKNEEQLSSELEDASYDYYRRMLRTNIVGASDEEHEEFVGRKLFGSARSPQAEVWEQYAVEHPEAMMDTEDMLQSLGEPLPPNVAAEVSSSLAQMQERDQLLNAAVQQQLLEVERLRSQPKSAAAQGGLAAANAGLGIGIALLSFKATVWGLQRVLRAIRKSKKKAGTGGRPTGPVQRQRSGSQSGAGPQAAQVTAARGQTSRAQQQAGSSTQAAQQSQQQQQQQIQQQQQAASQQAVPPARSRPSARRR